MYHHVALQSLRRLTERLVRLLAGPGATNAATAAEVAGARKALSAPCYREVVNWREAAAQ
jgi:hypothetical protein